MKLLLSMVILLASGFAAADEFGGAEPILPPAKFFAESIEFNVVTQKYQLFAPFYESKDGKVAISADAGAVANLCRFYDFQGGRLLQQKQVCAGTKLLTVSEDGAYVVQTIEEQHCGFAVTVFDCEPIAQK